MTVEQIEMRSIENVTKLRGDTFIDIGNGPNPEMPYELGTALVGPGQEIIAHHLDGQIFHASLTRLLGNKSRGFETSIPIVPESVCQRAVQALKIQFSELSPNLDQVCIVPIEKGGNAIGKVLAETGAVLNPMQMTNYDGDGFQLPNPVCLKKPDVMKFISPDGFVRKVILAEAVVDTQRTIKEANKIILSQIESLRGTNGYPSNLPKPEMYTFALVSKIPQEAEIIIPNLTAALWVHPEIWIFGWGCDSDQNGREVPYIGGHLPPLAKTPPPSPPYWRPLLSL